MSKKRYVVSLTAEERGELQGLIKRGKLVAARKRLHAQALLKGKKQKNPPVPRKLDGAAEARLIATVQGPPPDGRSRWTLRLLSDRIVELGICDEPVSHSAIGRALKKTS